MLLLYPGRGGLQTFWGRNACLKISMQLLRGGVAQVNYTIQKRFNNAKDKSIKYLISTLERVLPLNVSLSLPFLNYDKMAREKRRS